MTTNYKLPEPVAWLHEFHNYDGLYGIPSLMTSLTADSPYGVPGIDHNAAYEVVSIRLHPESVVLAAYEAGKAENKQWKDTRYKELSSIANGATIRAESEMVEKNDARRKLITQAEALKLAKEALEHSLEFQGPHRQVVNEALAAINALENSNG